MGRKLKPSPTGRVLWAWWKGISVGNNAARSSVLPEWPLLRVISIFQRQTLNTKHKSSENKVLASGHHQGNAFGKCKSMLLFFAKSWRVGLYPHHLRECSQPPIRGLPFQVAQVSNQRPPIPGGQGDLISLSLKSLVYLHLCLLVSVPQLGLP